MDKTAPRSAGKYKLSSLPGSRGNKFVTDSRTASATSVYLIQNDDGGEIKSYEKKYRILKDSGQPVVIDGKCNSACTLALGIVPLERICVTPRAHMGFHAAYFDREAIARHVSNISATELKSLEQPIQDWIAKHGGLTPETRRLLAAGEKAPDNANKILDGANTEKLMSYYPEPLKAWIVKQGGLTEALKHLKDDELKKIVHPCSEEVSKEVRQIRIARAATTTLSAAPDPPTVRADKPRPVTHDISLAAHPAPPVLPREELPKLRLRLYN